MWAQQLSLIIWSVTICWKSVHASTVLGKVCSCPQRSYYLVEKNRLKRHELIIRKNGLLSCEVLSSNLVWSQRKRFLKTSSWGHSMNPWLLGKTLECRTGPFRRKCMSCIWNVCGEQEETAEVAINLLPQSNQ